jgi:hypothetical protein
MQPERALSPLIEYEGGCPFSAHRNQGQSTSPHASATNQLNVRTCLPLGVMNLLR